MEEITKGKNGNGIAEGRANMMANSESFRINLDLRDVAAIIGPLIHDPNNDLLNVYSLIDYPNFFRHEIVNQCYLNFFAFRAILESYRMPNAYIVKSLKVFIKPFREHNEDWRVYERMRKVGMETVFTPDWTRDTDPYIIKSLQEINQLDCNICLNLVSGDKVYYDFVEEIKENCLRKDKTFALRIFSWDDRMAEIWKKLADEIIYWDDMILFINSFVAKQFTKIKLDPCFK